MDNHEPVLITTLAVGFVAAAIGGLVARRVRLSPIVGYIAAGIVVGQNTPGPVADATVATELAEIGIILLMFGVGAHFSVRDLLAVRTIAIPGAVVQSTVATILGLGLGIAMGWGFAGGLVLGLALSVASTVVLLRALEERGSLDTREGRIAIGWLIVEDLFTVVVLVLLPSIAPLLQADAGASGAPGASADAMGPVVGLAVALGKAGVFLVLMIVFGARVVPWLLDVVARERSRELFTLAVLATAVGLAFFAYSVFGVSLALGAFLAGIVVGESETGHQAVADALPLRDAFAVLFFVSVGMLLDPAALLANALPVVAVLLLVMVGKSIAAFAIVVLLRYPVRTAVTVAAALAQVGEFSFILGTAGVSLGLLPVEGFQLIVAAALLSIALNPVAFRLVTPLEARLGSFGPIAALARPGDPEPAPGADHPGRRHAIIDDYDRIGRLIAGALVRRGFHVVVVTLERDDVDRARRDGLAAIYGDPGNVETLERADIHHARLVVLTSADPFTSRRVVEGVRSLAPDADLVIRTDSDAESLSLRALSGRVWPIHAGREAAAQMVRAVLHRFGVPPQETEAIAQGLRVPDPSG